MKFYLYIWAMPNTLIGLALSLLYGAKDWRWSDGCLEAIATRPMIGHPGAQTWGWLIYYADDYARRDAGLRMHERVHVRHGLIGGPLFFVAYAAHWLWLMATIPMSDGTKRPRWYRAYRLVWSERIAYKVQEEIRE